MQKQDKLAMINKCLQSIGEVPLLPETVLDTLPVGTDGETALRIVEETMTNVQARGWHFNTDYNLPLVPDTQGFITMPPNTLRVDFGNTEYRHRYQLKNGRIYDMKEHTFVIEETLEADVVWEVDYEELSIAGYEYISLRAARKFQTAVIGSLETDSFTVRDEQEALVQLQREQLQVMDFTLRDNKVSTRSHSGYLVKGLYSSTGRRDY